MVHSEARMSRFRLRNSRRLGAFRVVLALFAFAAGAASERAHALGLDSLGFDPNSLVSDDVVKSLTNFMAFGAQHRPYEPATPLGVSVGLDVSLEVTLFKVPSSFFESLASVGLPMGTEIPSLPIGKLHLHKGFGDTVDLGGSILYYKDYKLIGGDIKFVIIQGEEGPTWALRFCYTYTDVKFSGGDSGADINLSTKTFSPQLLVSRQMEFADPYLGLGLEYGSGAVDATVTVPADILAQLPAGVPIPADSVPPQSLHKTASAYGAYLFGGVSLRVPRSGLRFTIEGSYNTAGTSTLGLKTGFTF